MSDDAAARLRDALELADLAERMVLARLRREHPAADHPPKAHVVRATVQDPASRPAGEDTLTTSPRVMGRSVWPPSSDISSADA